MCSSLIPGVNIDQVDVAAGMQKARQVGYGNPAAQMVIEYALMRHRRGEEDGAERTWRAQFPRDLTSWKMILAHAITAASAKTPEGEAS